MASSQMASHALQRLQAERVLNGFVTRWQVLQIPLAYPVLNGHLSPLSVPDWYRCFAGSRAFRYLHLCRSCMHVVTHGSLNFGIRLWLCAVLAIPPANAATRHKQTTRVSRSTEVNTVGRPIIFHNPQSSPTKNTTSIEQSFDAESSQHPTHTFIRTHRNNRKPHPATTKFLLHFLAQTHQYERRSPR